MASRFRLEALLCLPLCVGLGAQEVVPLPGTTDGAASGVRFAFVSDGPIAPGWSRPDEPAHAYFEDELPALFERTVALDGEMPSHGKLMWLFTGPHAGFTVELSGSKVRLVERYYDSMGLYSQGNFPEKIVREEERQYTGRARRLTVILDGHLAVRVLLNGVEVLQTSCVFDVTRHQMMFSAPRTEHVGIGGTLLTPQVSAVSIKVKESKKHQTMLGFGGSPSIPAYERLSAEGKARYWELLRHYNLLIDREYPMGSELKRDLSNMADLSEATPHYYGDNFPNGEVSDFAYSKHAMELGGEVIYEMWALPPWAQVAYVAPGRPLLDAWNKPVRQAANPEEYARIVVGYARKLKAATGAGPAIVGVQNEVEQPAEVFAAMTTTLRRELDKAGFQATKIHMADASYMYYGVSRAQALKKDNAAWAATDFTAAHEYDFQEYMANPDLYDARLLAMRDASAGKGFLATEICLNDPHYQEGSYRLAFQVGQLYWKNLTELDAEALMYCWLLLDVEQPTFAGSRSLLEPDRTRAGMVQASGYELRVLGAFSRHVLKGMVRVDSESGDPDLLSVAFTGSGKTTVVLMNRGTETRRVAVDWPGKPWKQIERVGVQADGAPVAGDVLLRGGEMVTLSDFVAN
jgi:hypothetical protein